MSAPSESDLTPFLQSSRWIDAAHPRIVNLPGIHAEPLPQVIAALTRANDVHALWANLPDLQPA